MSSSIEYPLNDDKNVIADGDFRSIDDLIEGEMPESYRPIQNETITSPTHRKEGPLETRVDDWLDIHNINGSYNDKDACEKLHISYEDYMAEIRASLAPTATPVEAKLGGRAVIEGFRAAREADMTPSEAAMHAAAARSRDQSNPKVG